MPTRGQRLISDVCLLRAIRIGDGDVDDDDDNEGERDADGMMIHSHLKRVCPNIVTDRIPDSLVIRIMTSA
jgi:hypothetical protein